MSGPVIYLIAGEASGDALGAGLLRALKAKMPEAQFFGVGGPKMEAEGLSSLFPMREISLMGFVEILPHLPHLLRRIRETVADIRVRQPAVVVTIDSPGFCKRVIREIQDMRQGRQGLRCVHYVAPTVWAYRPERAETFAALFDHLLCLLPFEPPYFEKAGLKASFIGHPVTEENFNGDAKALRKDFGFGEMQPLLSLLPGSRKGEWKRHLPVYRETVAQLKEEMPGLGFALLAAEGMEEALTSAIADWPVKPAILPQVRKADLFAAATAALVKSGTGALELAAGGVPMVVTYKVHPLSARMMRKMIRIRFVNLVNILEGREVVPELLQEFCRANMLVPELLKLVRDEKAREAQRQAFKEAVTKLRPEGGKKAAEVAAGIIEKAAQSAA